MPRQREGVRKIKLALRYSEEFYYMISVAARLDEQLSTMEFDILLVVPETSSRDLCPLWEAIE